MSKQKTLDALLEEGDFKLAIIMELGRVANALENILKLKQQEMDRG